MTTVRLSPIGNTTLFSPTTGLIANGYKLFFYAAATSTKQNTYTTSAGSVANSNPIVLDAYGMPTDEVWLTEGQSYKIVLAPPSDTDPPSSGVTLADYVTGINDTTVTDSSDQWLVSSLNPTYLTGTTFSVTGDQTAILHVGRRLKTSNTGGTIYSTITNSVYGAVTTITVSNDSGNLDSGLSVINYSLLTSVNPAIPKIALPDGSTATTQAATDNNAEIATTAYVHARVGSAPNDFRLTLTTSVPVTTSDVTGATTIYCTPYLGNRIALYNGTNWDVLTSAQFSVALGTITNDQGYDVFCYSNSGTPTLEILAWTNNTTRATALAYQDGVLVKSGDATRRYAGSFLTTATTTTEDSAAKRYLFNYSNRVERPMIRQDGTASWNYTTATWRQANASTSNQLNFFVGVVEENIDTSLLTQYSNSTASIAGYGALGLNSTSTIYRANSAMSGGANKITSSTVRDFITPVLGKNYIAWLENSDAAGTGTFYGAGALLAGIINA